MVERTVPTNRRAILLAIFIAFGGFLFGYDIGVISGCLIMPDFTRRFGDWDEATSEWVLNSHKQSIITSLLSAGTFVGAIGQAFTSDRFGRRGSILIWSFIFTIGTVIQTATETSIAQMSVGRFVAGLGVGAMSAIVPLYNGETAPKALRGILLVMYQLQIIFGIFVSYVIGLGTHTISNSASWRIPVGLQMLWGLIILSGIFFLPESPRHLLGTSRIDEARKVVAELNSVPVDDPLVEEMVEDLMFGIRAENDGGKATWAECFSTRNQLWKRTVNGMMLQFIQQLNGQNFYYYYGDTFFKSAGTSLSPYAIQTILGGVSVVGTVPALYAIETMGRRQSLLTGSVLEAIFSLVAALVGHFCLAPANTPADQLTSGNKAGGNAIIAFAVLHVFSYAVFWGPVPWVYLGESFPLRIRPKSIALGSATNWLWNFLLSFFSPRIADDIGPLILLIFCGVLVFGWFYVYFFIPETKGLSLEEVDEMYRANVKPWRSSTWRPSQIGEITQDSSTKGVGEKGKGEIVEDTRESNPV
ncbi:general substrate transporter [Cylindrobasidium torrendii FP15055 ss-10]|uniref:General substrate transporter n=1 Tax=Cylindrobasidium torrendii FP15055 ss-10 TaxID=1314674 RepID=A0A0D7B4P5_9AGAR|nr:general substrate transporter [Cylindrobasidium torrendii FP15055 ss-10]